MISRELLPAPQPSRTAVLLGSLAIALLLACGAAAAWAWPEAWRIIAAGFGPSAAVVGAATLLLAGEARRRARSETALAETGRQYRSALDDLDEVVFRMDASGRWTSLNRAWAEITLHPVEESLRRPFLAYVHPDDRAHATEAFQLLMNGEDGDCRCELRLMARDGGVRRAEIFVRLTRDDSGEVVGTAGRLRDVTEERATSEALAASGARLHEVTAILESTLEHIGEGVLVIGADRDIPFCNRRAIEMLDLGAEAMATRPSFDELSRRCQTLAFGTLDLSSDAAPVAEMLQVFDRQSPNGRLLELRSAALPQGGVVRIYAEATEPLQAEPPSREHLAGEPSAVAGAPEGTAAAEEGTGGPTGKPATPAELRDAVVAAFGASLAPEADSPLFDDEKLARLRRTYGAAAPRFVSLFRKEAEARLHRIADLLSADDTQLLVAEAQSMRSSAATFGCRAVEDAAARLEEAARLGAIEALPRLAEELERAFAVVRDELANRLRPAA